MDGTGLTALKNTQKDRKTSNNQILQLKLLEKQEQAKAKISRRREII
jgi:hypothetical protein